MWFLWFLLVLDIAAAILLLRFRALAFNGFIHKIVADPITSFILLVCVSAVIYLPLAAIYSPWQWIGYGPIEIQAAFAPQYALYFACGVVVGIYGLDQSLLNVNGKLVQRWRYWIFGSIAAFLGWIGPTAVMVRDHTGAPGGLQIAANLALVIFSVVLLSRCLRSYCDLERPVGQSSRQSQTMPTAFISLHPGCLGRWRDNSRSTTWRSEWPATVS